MGILIDITAQRLELPQEKLRRVQRLIRSWNHRSACKKRELLSLLGHLHHAASVVSPGRIFTRSLTEGAKKTRHLHHFVRLNSMMKADLAWWSAFLPLWNGRHSFLPDDPSITVTSDASGSWGCGAFVDSTWFQVQWPTTWEGHNIARKEMAPVLLAAATWGKRWAEKCVLFRSDNMAVVTVLQKKQSKRSGVITATQVPALLCSSLAI